MRAFRRRTLGTALVATLATAGIAGAAHAGSPLGPPAADPGNAKAGKKTAPELTGPVAEKLKRQEALLPVAREFAAQARSASSDIAGVRIDPDSGTVHVYRTDTGKPLAIGSKPAGVKIDVHAAKFSRNDMNDATGRVKRDARLLGEQQVSVAAVGPQLDGSGIDVTVVATDAAQVDKASSLLKDRYGDIVDDVNAVGRKTSDDQLYFSGWRFNDFAPWYGGDRVRMGSGGGCSTGFAAVYNNAPAMLTAAHCGGVGESFSNGPRTDGTFRFMGNANYSNSGTDVASIGVTGASNYINVGSALSPTQLYISYWASPVVGEYLCQSGSYTGETCGLRVVDTNQSVCQSWFLWWCTSWQGPLADVINSAGSGSYAAGHGDSGGPVYLRMGTYGIAKGLVHGQLTPNAQNAYPAYFPDTMWCPAPEGWQQRCSSGFSFAHMPGY